MGVEALLNVKRGGGAPHKPLLLLAALDHYRAGDPRLISFENLERRFAQLATVLRLEKEPRIQEPFWRLQRDGIWEITGMASGYSSPPSRAQFRAPGVAGGLSESAHEEVLQQDIAQVMRRVSEHYFEPNEQVALKEHLGI